MADITYLYNNFLLGEITPKMQGQSNSPLYKVSCKEATNVKVTREAAITRRSGTIYQDETATTTETRLIELDHTNGSFFQLEFSNLKFRIFKDGVLQGAPTEVTTVYTTADLPNISYDIDNDQIYLTTGTHPPKVITRISDTNWTFEDVNFTCAPFFEINHPTYGRTKDLGNTAITISSLSANTLGGSATLVMSGDLFEAEDVGKFIRIKNFTSNPSDEANASITTTNTTTNVLVQDGYVNLYNSTFGTSDSTVPNLYVLLPAITTATRTTPYSTIVTTTTRSYNGSSPATTGTTGGNANGTWSYITDMYTGSVQTNETYTVTGNETETWGLVQITGYTNATTVTVEIKRELSSTNFHSSQQWQMSMFGENTGYPKEIVFHESRLLYKNIGEYQDVLVGSKTNKILDFENGEDKEGTLTAASGFYYKLSGVNSIKWAISAQRLVIGSSTGVYSLVGRSDTGLNALEAPIFRKIADSKCNKIKPLFMQDAIFYVHQNRKAIGHLSFQQGAFSGFIFKDISRYCEHLLTAGIKNIVQQNEYLWALTLDGQLKGMTYEENEQVLGGHKHTIGGSIDSMCVTNGELYLVVDRTINSTTVKYLEKMAPDIQNEAQGDTVCVDSAVIYTGSAITTLTGLDHLEGETVEILVDGFTHNDQVVESGQIELDSPAEKVIAGLSYTSVFETNEMNEGNRKGSREGKKTDITNIGLKLLNTNGINIISKTGVPNAPPFNIGQIYGEGSKFFTGTLKKTYKNNNTLNPTVKVASFKALPFTVQSIVADCGVTETS